MMRWNGQRARLGAATAAIVAGALAALQPGAAAAGQVPVESHVLDHTRVTLHVYPFLDPTELMTLRALMTNAKALALFLPKGGHGGYGAIAVAPTEGFIRDGKPVASAVALAGLTDAKTADKLATQSCDSKRSPLGKACVVVLDVAPKG